MRYLVTMTDGSQLDTDFEKVPGDPVVRNTDGDQVFGGHLYICQEPGGDEPHALAFGPGHIAAILDREYANQHSSPLANAGA